MIIRKAMYGCGLYFFIKLAYNSPILCKFADECRKFYQLSSKWSVCKSISSNVLLVP